MLQQEIVSLALQTYLLLSELFVQCLSYCVPDLGSNNHVTNHNENVRHTKNINKKNMSPVLLITCSGAPLLTLCILPS